MGRNRTERRRRLIVDRAAQQRLISSVTLIPTAALAIAAILVAVHCRQLLSEATRLDVDLASLGPLFWSVVGFTAAAVVAIVHQAVRVSNKVIGPAYRLGQSMRRVRGGDLAFRVHLRRGDHLTDLAEEFNRLLDWLNENPPAGARTGGDEIEVELEELDGVDDPEDEDVVGATAAAATGDDDDARS